MWWLLSMVLCISLFGGCLMTGKIVSLLVRHSTIKFKQLCSHGALFLFFFFWPFFASLNEKTFSLMCVYLFVCFCYYYCFGWWILLVCLFIFPLLAFTFFFLCTVYPTTQCVQICASVLIVSLLSHFMTFFSLPFDIKPL